MSRDGNSACCCRCCVFLNVYAVFWPRSPILPPSCPFPSSPVLCCVLSLPSPHASPSFCEHPLIESHVISALRVALCDSAPGVRFLAVSAVQHLITVAGVKIDDAPQLLPPLCMNRFHHADGVKAAAQVSIHRHVVTLTNATALTQLLIITSLSFHHSAVTSP